MACELRSCGPNTPEVLRLEGWQAWRRGGERCLRRAWVEELLAFPAAHGVEKNWNLIEAETQRLFIEYFIEPHVVSRPLEGLESSASEVDGHVAARGRSEQLFGSTRPLATRSWASEPRAELRVALALRGPGHIEVCFGPRGSSGWAMGCSATKAACRAWDQEPWPEAMARACQDANSIQEFLWLALRAFKA